MRLRRILLTSALALSFVVTTPAVAKADPVTATIVAFAGFTAGTTAAAVATFVVNAALSALTTFAVGKVSAALSGKNKAGIQERQASVTTLSLGEAPRELLIGEVCTGGTLVDAFNFGGKYGTDTVTRCVAVADHALDGVVGFYVDDKFYPWAGGGVIPGFSGKLSIRFLNATANGFDPQAHVLNAGAGWTTSDRLAGMAVFWVDYTYDEKVWAQGHPQIKFVVRGLRAYDMRFDPAFGYTGPSPQTWANRASHTYTRNAAVLRYAFTRGIYAEGHQGDPDYLLMGRGLTAEEAPPERIIAAANLCDESVDGAARYTANGVIRASDDFIAVEEMFAAAMAGQIVQREGGVEVEPGQAKAAAVTITDGALVVGEPVTFSAFLPDTDGGRINTVIPRYISPAQNWKDHSGPVRRDPVHIQADGGPRELTLPLVLVTSGAQANRCAEINRLAARLERRATIVLPPEYANLEEGDWIAWQSARHHGGATVRYRIESWSLDEKWRMRLSLREIASSVYGVPDPVEDKAAVPPAPTPVDALELDGVGAAAITLPGETSVMPAIRLTWSIPVDAAVSAIRAEVRVVGGTDIAPTREDNPTKGVMVVTNGVGAEQDLQARLVPIGDPSRPVLPSPWITISTAQLVAGDVAPTAPTIQSINAQITEVFGDIGDVSEALDAATIDLELSIAATDQRVLDADQRALAAEAVLTAKVTGGPNALPNPTFADGLNQWSVETGAAWSTFTVDGGSYALSPAAGSGVALRSSPTSRIPVSGNAAYTFAVDLSTSGFGTGEAVNINVRWYRADGSAIGYSASTTVVGNQPWTRRSVTDTSPSDAASCYVRIVGSSLSAGARIRARRAKFEPGTVATVYSEDEQARQVLAGISALQTATADLELTKAEATDLNLVQVEINGARGGAANLGARLLSDRTAAANATSTVATDLDVVEAEITGARSGSANLAARLLTDRTAAANATSSVATDLDVVEAEMSAARNGSATLNAQLSTMRQARVDGDGANATAIASTNARTNAAEADIDTLTLAQASEALIRAQAIQQVTAQTDPVALNINSTFANYPSATGLPPNFVASDVPAAVYARQPGKVSPYAVRIDTTANVSGQGFRWSWQSQNWRSLFPERIGGDYWVIEYKIEASNGRLNGTGFELNLVKEDGSGSGGGSYAVGLRSLAGGDVPSATIVEGQHFFRCDRNQSKVRADLWFWGAKDNFPVYNGASPGQVGQATRTYVHRLALRPATEAEIQARVALPALSSQVTQQSLSIIDLEQQQALAAYEVAAAASGGLPAFLRLVSSSLGGYAALAAPLVALLNTVPGGAPLVAMEARDGQVYFGRPIYIAMPGTSFHLIVGGGGPSGSQWLLWFGPNTTTAATATRTNGAFALGTDGKPYLGAASLVQGSANINESAPFSGQIGRSNLSRVLAGATDAVTVPSSGRFLVNITASARSLGDGSSSTESNGSIELCIVKGGVETTIGTYPVTAPEGSDGYVSVGLGLAASQYVTHAYAGSVQFRVYAQGAGPSFTSNGNVAGSLQIFFKP